VASPTSRAIDAAAQLSAVVSFLWITAHLLRSKAPTLPARAKPSLWLHPWTLFLLTTALLLANQIAFSAFLLAAHGGDASFITRFTGDYYFHIDRTLPGVQALAAAFGRSGAETWLAPSLLRVNAVLELPFALFAYLAITRLFDPAAARLITRSSLGSLGVTSFTFVLCVVEVQLKNPWTTQDLVLRWVSCLLCGLALRAIARRDDHTVFPSDGGRPRTLVGFSAALLGTAAIAGAVLVLYDVTLLYNMAHLRQVALPLTAAIVIGTFAFSFVPRIDAFLAKHNSAPSAAVATMGAFAASLAVFFFVPALAVRYGMGRAAGQLSGASVVVVAVIFAIVRTARNKDVRTGRYLLGLGLGVAASVVCLSAGHAALTKLPMAEMSLLGHVALAVAPLLLAWRGAELVGLR
jgi:hypothetical protein